MNAVQLVAESQANNGIEIFVAPPILATRFHRLGETPMKTRLFPVLAVVFFGGCAWQSEAMKVGEDTYQTSANASPMRGGKTGAQEMALANANRKCDELRKQINVTDVKTEWGFPSNGVATVTFTCK